MQSLFVVKDLDLLPMPHIEQDSRTLEDTRTERYIFVALDWLNLACSETGFIVFNK